MNLAGSGGIYEVLLIVLVVILIFNGLLRQKIMKKVHDDMSDEPIRKSSPQKNRTIEQNHEYVDYEEVNDD